MKKITNRLIKRFKEYLTNEEKSKATIEKYIRDITAFSVWCASRDLCKNTVLEYKEHLITDYAPASVNSVLSSLNNFFDFTGMYNLKVKTLKIQKQIFASKDKELTKAEYERLLKAARSNGNEKLYLLMQTICSCGLRVSELQYITCSALKSRQANISLKGKMRVVFIPDDLCKALLKYTKEQNITNGSIFVTKTGKPLDRSNIWKLLKGLCEAAGVDRKKVFPHNFRHLFARTFYSLQKDIVRLADILGHSSVNTTRLYTMETGETHRKQINKLGLFYCRE